MPPWCEEGEEYAVADTEDVFDHPFFLTRIDQVQIPILTEERLASHHADAIGWQGLAIESEMFKMGSRQLIGTARRLNMPVIASMNVRWLIRASPIDYEETATVDLHGTPIRLGDLQQFVHGTYWRNLLKPSYREMLIADAKTNLDLGVRGIVFDDDGDGKSGGTIYNYGASFDEYSMTGFRNYLKNSYSEQALKDTFGINNIDQFHFGEYIIANDLEHTWNKDRLNPHPLTHEFQQYLANAGRQVLKEVIAELRAYALEEHNLEPLISFNISPIFAGKLYGGGYDLVDMLYGEHFWFHTQHFKGAVAAKLAEGLTDRQFTLLFEVNHDRGNLPEPIGNLFKYAFADVYATGNTGLQITYPGAWTMDDMWTYVDPLTYDVVVFEHYAGFLQDNRELFGLDEPANVAVVHSLASRRLDYLPVDNDLHNWGEPDRQLISMVDMLLNLNVPFHMLVSGEGMLGVHDTIDAATLAPYELIILPDVMVLSDPEVEALIQYAQGGGRVIQVNEFAGLNAEGERVSRPEIATFSQNSGRHDLGSGLWITEDWGSFEYDYLYGDGMHLLPTEQNSDNQHLVRLQQLLDENVTLDIKVEGPLTVSVRRFKDSQRLVLHVVNYDYDHINDTFTPSGPVEIEICSQGLQNGIGKALLFDIENRLQEEISFEEQGGIIKLTIPNVDVYSIIELK